MLSIAEQKSDYYRLLGIKPDASTEQIKAAYRSAVRRWHPDMRPPSEKVEADRMVKKYNEAYEVLKNPAKRKIYDLERLNSLQAVKESQSHGYHLSKKTRALIKDIKARVGTLKKTFSRSSRFKRGSRLKQHFKKGSRHTGAGGESKGNTSPGCESLPELIVDLPLSIEDAYQGTAMTVHVEKRIDCNCLSSFFNDDGRVGRGAVAPTAKPDCSCCRGAGYLKVDKSVDLLVPPWSTESTLIRLCAAGFAAADSSKRGDLLFRVRYKPHPYYRLDGEDIIMVKKISPTLAAAGAGLTVPTLDGPVKITVPPGTVDGDAITLKGKGLPGKDGLRGAYYIQLKVV